MIGLISKLAGWKGYAAASLISAAVAAGATWAVQGWRYGAQIANIERDQARGGAEAAETALAQLRHDIDTIAAAGRRAAAVGPALTAQINKLTGALKDAPPLPDGCRPDSVRVRSLIGAVRAANSAAAGQQPGAAVPGNP